MNGPMYESFLSLARTAPDAVAVIEGSGTVTRDGLLRRTRVVAAQLSAAGLQTGDAVAVQLPNSADFVAAVLAASQLGLVLVPIDRDAPRIEVASYLSHFSIGALIYYESGELTVTTRGVELRPPLPPEARLIKLSSGSSGLPKGIVVSEANLIADATSICSTMGITGQDICLAAIPLSHSYGFANLVMPLLMQGTAMVLANDYLPQCLLDLANEHRCTVAPLIPMVFEHIQQVGAGSFDSVRVFLSAGAPLPAATSRRFRERFGRDIHSFYGCSECGGIAYDREGGAVERGTVGGAMDNVVLTTEATRLQVRSDAVALGVLLDGRTYQPLTAGHFETDDLVELRDGEVFLTGRVSDLINTAGKKVNPREVETVILQMPGVREAKVFGSPAGARGDVVAVAVVATPDVTREQVREYCRTRLSAHKVPRIVKLIDAIPVDERGKVKKAALALL